MGHPKEQYLQNLADRQLHLFDGMPQVKVKVFEEETPPFFESGKFLSWAMANEENKEKYKRWKATGYFDGTNIFIKSWFASRDEVTLTNLLKHELIHAWVWWKHKSSEGHGPLFNQKAREVGVAEQWD